MKIAVLFLTLVQIGLAESNWKFSAGLVAGATALDAGSSWGQQELNPALGRGTFAGRQLAIKGSIAGALVLTEWLVMRKHPETRRAWTYANWAAAGATAGVAARNFR